MITNKNKIFLSPPYMGNFEKEFLLEAFDSNWIAPLGPNVDRFENVPIKKCLSCRDFRRKYPVSI